MSRPDVRLCEFLHPAAPFFYPARADILPRRLPRLGPGPRPRNEASLPQPIFILVGTMTGTAEIVAEDVRDMFKAQGREAELILMDDLDPAVFQKQGTFLICTSTYGQGDVPDNAMKLFGALEKQRPSLSAVRYGVIALGDRAYNETYTYGGQRFDKLLTELGASRIGQVCQHDASGTDVPEEVGVAWARGWLAELDAAGA